MHITTKIVIMIARENMTRYNITRHILGACVTQVGESLGETLMLILGRKKLWVYVFIGVVYMCVMDAQWTRSSCVSFSISMYPYIFFEHVCIKFVFFQKTFYLCWTPLLITDTVMDKIRSIWGCLSALNLDERQLTFFPKSLHVRKHGHILSPSKTS